MGNLLSLHRDILRKIYREYLSYYDRIPLLNTVGINYHENIGEHIGEHIGEEIVLGEYMYNGYLNLIEWYIEVEKINVGTLIPINQVYLLSRAFKGGRINILDWLYKVQPELITSYSYYSYYRAIYNDNLNVLIWLNSLNIAIDVYCLVSKAIEYDRLEIIKWIKNTYNDWSWWDFWTADAQDRLHMNEIINNQMNFCIIHNRYEIFLWFAEQYISLDHSGEEKRKFINVCNDENFHYGHDNSEVIKIKTYLESLLNL